MAESAFQRYLFKNFGAVYFNGLSQLATNLKLLDVLIKTDSEGLLHPRPVVKRAGSMIGLGTASSMDIEERLREVLTHFEQDLGMYVHGSCPTFKIDR